MARYTYRCNQNSKCDVDLFEVQKFMSEATTPEVCPQCRKPAERDLFTDAQTLYYKDDVKTLGGYMLKKSSKMSTDEKLHRENENREHNTRIRENENREN